jgi:hypothetical protein
MSPFGCCLFQMGESSVRKLTEQKIAARVSSYSLG